MICQTFRKAIITLLFFACAAGAIAAQAPEVKLRALDGGAFDLAENRGRVVVLAFGGTWLPFVNRSKPALQRLAERFAGRDVDFYWVSVNSATEGARNYASDADLQKFAEQRGLRLKILRDPDQTAYRALGVDALPTLVFINRDGLVCYRHVGFDTKRPDGYSAAARALGELLK
jgi:peroxiredoxin